MKDKLIPVKEALSHIKSNATLMVSGFFQGGSPEFLLRHMEGHGARNLTLISSDTGQDGHNLCKYMFSIEGMITKVYANYILRNSAVQAMCAKNPDSVTLIPQGNFAEKIRAGGAGIPAFYTPVGVGTIVEEGKEKRMFNGREYLLETAFFADVALIHASKADAYGNCYMRKASKNFNVIMAMAASYVIVETEELVPVGGMDPDLIDVPSIFIDAVIPIESRA